jgi:hypothetical protein
MIDSLSACAISARLLRRVAPRNDNSLGCHCERREAISFGVIAGDPNEEADAEQRGALAASVAGADRLDRGDARRPGAAGREHAGVEHAVQHVAIEQHRQRGADQHRHDQIRAAEQERHADRQQEAVGGAEGRRRDRALRQVLDVDRAVAGEECERHPDQQHRDEGADDRGVRRHAELQDQLHADHRAEHAQHDQQDQGRRREGRGMLRLARGDLRHRGGSWRGAGQIAHHGNPGQDGGSSSRYRMARRSLPMVLSCPAGSLFFLHRRSLRLSFPWERGCSSMAEQKLPKLTTRVRFPSPAPCI